MLLKGLLSAVASLATVWAVSALIFDFAWSAALLYAAVVLLTLLITKFSFKGILLWFASLALVVGWWFTLQPTNNRDWQPEVAKLPWADLQGSQATIHNIRDFDWHSETTFTPQWETRTIDISQIQCVDLFISHWGTPLIAHALVSFAFRDGTYMAMSIEARKAVGQEYSAVRAFFRQFELIYLVAEERDIVRVRTNFRGEHIYLYRTLTKPQDAQDLFRQYLGWMNQVRSRPEWYNAVTRNCASSPVSYLAHSKIGGIKAWDLRALLVGPGDKMLYELGDLAGNLPFSELQPKALIDAAAQKASPQNFSAAIRESRPGFN